MRENAAMFPLGPHGIIFNFADENKKRDTHMKQRASLWLVTAMVVAAGMMLQVTPSQAAEKGILQIVTNPGDARIFINGKRKGNSPAEAGQLFSIKLEEGEYKVEAIRSIGGAFELYGVKKDVFVGEDSKQTITLKLKKRRSAAFVEELKRKYPGVVPEPQMVSIPAGSFRMGCVSGKDCSDDEKPMHTVTLSAFEMGVTEVTFLQWDACFFFGGCDNYPDDEGWGRGSRPAINVSWEDAQQYIAWLNTATGKHYRLPTEAEWEYAARAGSATRYSWGDELGKNKANCGDCGSQWDKQTAPVGSFQANGFGLFDMHGNVWEWVQDLYDEEYYSSSSAQNPQGPDTGRSRVNRGGCWGSSAKSMRSAIRLNNSPGVRYDGLGFRLLRTPE
jgi:formylglycine-generating enzyme required for sulfatase activity